MNNILLVTSLSNFLRGCMPLGLLLLIFSVELHSAELSKSFKDKALAVMKSSDVAKRKAAYRAFQGLGNDTLDDYRDLLEKAQVHHRSALAKAMGVRGNPYSEHARGMDEIELERSRVMELVHTDWEKKSSKIKMLENEVESIERKYKKLTKLAKAKTDSVDKNTSAAMAALLEIQWELASIERLSDGENTAEIPTQKELLGEIAEGFYEVEDWLKQQGKMEITRKSEIAKEDANKHNAACKWASAAQKDFSDHLNHYRVVMGQNPMLLEEQLSAAAEGHSSDMKEGVFFSHTSPVKDKESPADRAKMAKFSGRFTGENIYMGNTSYAAAYGAWFGSDGHRFIMFTKGASNVIGVGIDGRHWTMMTGRK